MGVKRRRSPISRSTRLVCALRDTGGVLTRPPYGLAGRAQWAAEVMQQGRVYLATRIRRRVAPPAD